MNIIDQLEQLFREFLKSTFSLMDEQLNNCQFSLNIDPAKQQFGDINSNAAMILTKELKRNPREIAQTIAANFSHPLIAKIEIAGPGFINIYCTALAWHDLAKELITQKNNFFMLAADAQKYRYNLEFVSANPTGPLHLGHGRGGIIGDVLGNVLSFLGHSVTKEYYINDVGNQIAKLGESFKIRCLQALGDGVAIPEDGYHGQYLIDLAQLILASHGAAIREKPASFFSEYAYTNLLEHIKITLLNYGISFDVWFSERQLYQDHAVEKVIKELTHRGYTYEKDDAVWFKSTEFGDDKDRVLERGNGIMTYVASDTAYLQNKIERGFDTLIMTLGQDHHSYVTRLQGLKQALGYTTINLDIIIYQLVTLSEQGEQLRMSKRAGRSVTLDDIIETVGKDVARFFYLNRKADAHLDFNLDLALKKTEENPVYYIQYAYVRIKSIIDKAAEVPEFADISPKDSLFVGPAEAFLIKKIIALKHLLNVIAATHQTHLLAYYAIELAQAFHAYYAKNRILDELYIDQSRGRLATIQMILNTFDLVLDLLGLTKPNRM
ncbi:MAG: arginine--tRNA ligase [Candidatus Babeliales bacterium]